MVSQNLFILINGKLTPTKNLKQQYKTNSKDYFIMIFLLQIFFFMHQIKNNLKEKY